MSCSFFFFNDTATTEIYTLSLHDALPISQGRARRPLDAQEREHRPLAGPHRGPRGTADPAPGGGGLDQQSLGDLEDRKSTRLNSSHVRISYAVFCLQKQTSTSNYRSWIVR